MSLESTLREELCRHAKSLFDRGFTVGSSGNISVRLPDGFLVTPTNSCFGRLDPARLSKVGPDWGHLSGDKPTKEIPLHRAMLAARPSAGAVVHLHSTYATAVSMLDDVDPADALPPMTPYLIMRVGPLAVVPYARPGAGAVEESIERAGASHKAILLANHGPVVADDTLEAAVFAAEELEESARLFLLTRGLPIRLLSAAQVQDLVSTFVSPSPR
jgi:ribulose-5-phosphate 4-epimerase/fuculose-1-phosphate aldolase